MAWLMFALFPLQMVGRSKKRERKHETNERRLKPKASISKKSKRSLKGKTQSACDLDPVISFQ